MQTVRHEPLESGKPGSAWMLLRQFRRHKTAEKDRLDGPLDRRLRTVVLARSAAEARSTRVPHRSMA
jgi:hypothetical protein